MKPVRLTSRAMGFALALACLSFRSSLQAESLEVGAGKTNSLAAPGTALRLGATNAVGRPDYENVDWESLAAYPYKIDWLVNPTNSNFDTLRPSGEIPAAVLALNSRAVAIQGYMKPLSAPSGGGQEFLLLRHHGLCCQTNIPQINEMIHVQMRGAGPAYVHERQYRVRGKFQVGAKLSAGNVVSVYQLRGAEMEIVAVSNAIPVAAHRHAP